MPVSPKRYVVVTESNRVIGTFTSEQLGIFFAKQYLTDERWIVRVVEAPEFA